MNNINELTHKIIGCAMQVHNTLGNGFQEVIYQRALALEFAFQGLSFDREKEMEISYREKHIGTRRVDFLLINFGGTGLEFKRVYNKKLVQPSKHPVNPAKHKNPVQECGR
ncbi:MAG TPA: GxxExxY protein [Bacteroidota bacterium]|jgi:hypothetical protein|nr:GxxExxY protein [Bacteroidota bacterium]